MYSPYRCIPLVAILGFLSACSSAPGATPKLRTTFSTASKGGYYQMVCEALDKAAERRGMKIECQDDSNGSQENIYRLEPDRNYGPKQKKAQFALVQSDVAHRAWQGEYPFDEPHRHIRLVAPLFTEKVHILVRPHQYLNSIAQLKGEGGVWMGAKNSGSRSSAFTLLRAAGLRREDIFNMAPTLLDAPKAFALLRSAQLPGAASWTKDGPPLDAVIDTEMPKWPFLRGILAASGIKMENLVPGKDGEFTVFLSPELSICGRSDLKGKNIWVPREWSRRQRAALKRLGIEGTWNEPNVQTAFEQLRQSKLDAMIQGSELSPELIESVLALGGYKVLSLGTAPGEQEGKLRAFVALGEPILSASDLAGKKLWWPEDKGLDQAIERAVCGSACKPELKPVREINMAMATDLLRLGALKAVLQTTAAPNAAIAGALDGQAEISLLALQLPLMEKLIADGSYVETSLQPNAYSSLKNGVYAVGVQTYLLTGLSDTGEQGQKVRLMARILREDQAAIEKELEAKLREARKGTVRDERNALQAQAKALQQAAQAQNFQEQVLEDQARALTVLAQSLNENSIPLAPSALVLLGRPVSSQLQDVVHDAAKNFLAFKSENDFSIFGELRRGELLQICELVAIIVALGLGVVAMERRRWLGRRLTSCALFSLMCALIWVLGAIYLQGVEGDMTQDFVSLTSAGRSLGETVLAHFRLPLNPPIPTTREGQLIMNIFSWLGAFLVGSYVLPYVKWLWRKRFEGLAEPESRAPASSTATEPMHSVAVFGVGATEVRSESGTSVAS